MPGLSPAPSGASRSEGAILWCSIRMGAMGSTILISSCSPPAGDMMRRESAAGTSTVLALRSPASHMAVAPVEHDAQDAGDGRDPPVGGYVFQVSQRPGDQCTKGASPCAVSELSALRGQYVVSPPISVRRIDRYDGQRVTYHYRSHRTERVEHETVAVDTFLGRMVQHGAQGFTHPTLRVQATRRLPR